jgi:hypothetical protein
MSEGNRIVVHHGAAGVMVHFEAARRALAEARSIDELRMIRNKAEALRLYVKQQGESLEMQNAVAEIKLRAERRAGKLLATMPKNTGSRGQGVPFHDGSTLTLKDLGISHQQSHRWQREAAVPEERFGQFLEEVKAKGEELTSRGLLDLARETENADRLHRRTERHKRRGRRRTMAGRHYANERELEEVASLARQLEQRLESITGLKSLAAGMNSKKQIELSDLLMRVGTTLKRCAFNLGHTATFPDGRLPDRNAIGDTKSLPAR